MTEYSYMEVTLRFKINRKMSQRKFLKNIGNACMDMEGDCYCLRAGDITPEEYDNI